MSKRLSQCIGAGTEKGHCDLVHLNHLRIQLASRIGNGESVELGIGLDPVPVPHLSIDFLLGIFEWKLIVWRDPDKREEVRRPPGTLWRQQVPCFGEKGKVAHAFPSFPSLISSPVSLPLIFPTCSSQSFTFTRERTTGHVYCRHRINSHNAQDTSWILLRIFFRF